MSLTGDVPISSIFEQVKPYLGEPNLLVNPNTLVNVTNITLADYYRGKNDYLKSTIVGLIIENNNWYTKTALPHSFNNQKNFAFNQIVFNAPMAGRVPHEGVVRLLTSETGTVTGTSVRRGIGFYMEQDFYRTEDGKDMFRMNLQAIVTSIKEAQDYDTVISLLNCQSKQERQELKMKALPYWTDRNAIEQQIASWGCSNKPTYLTAAITEAKNRISSGGSNIDLIIVTPGIRDLMDTTNVTKDESSRYMDFSLGEKVSTTKDGTAVVETRDFKVYEDTTESPLNKVVTIGETSMMSAVDCLNSIEPEHFTTKARDIKIYNNDINDYSQMSFERAFRETKLFDAQSDEYSDELKLFINRCNAKKNNNGKKDPVTGKIITSSPHFLASRTLDGDAKLIDYFGQMEEGYADDEYFIYIARTMAKELGGKDYVMEQMNKLTALMEKLNNVGYDETFITSVIGTARIARSNPEDPILGFETNSFGSLNLPSGMPFDTIPLGYNNLPGLLTLEREANNKNSSYQLLGKEAAAVMPFIRSMVETISKMCPTSEAINPKRSPDWFGRQAAAVALFSNVMFPKCIPLWLSKTAQSGSSTAVIDYKSLDTLDKDGVVNEYKKIFSGATTSKYVKTSDSDKKIMSASNLHNELTLAQLLKTLVLKSFVSILANLSDEDRLKLINKLHKRFDSKRRVTLNRVVLGLALLQSADVSKYAYSNSPTKKPDPEETALSNAAEGISEGDIIKYDIATTEESSSVDFVRSPLTLTDALFNDYNNDLRGARNGYFAISDGDANNKTYLKSKHINPERLEKDMLVNNKPTLNFIGVLFKSPTLNSGKDSASYDPYSSITGHKIDAPIMSESDDIDSISSITMEKRWTLANNSPNDITRILLQSFLLTRTIRSQWFRMMKMNILVPINIILWRLTIAHQMSSLILMHAGTETGSNIYGNASFNIAHDEVTKTIIGSFTFYSKAFVIKPVNVEVIENVKYNGYMGGSNDEYFETPSDFKDQRIARNSVIATAIPINEVQLPYMVSFIADTEGYLAGVNINSRVKSMYSQNGYSYSTSEFYTSVWGLDDKEIENDNYYYDNGSSKTLIPENFVALSGTQLNYDIKTRAFTTKKIGQGHRGNTVYPGSADVFNNKALYFEANRLVEVR